MGCPKHRLGVLQFISQRQVAWSPRNSGGGGRLSFHDSRCKIRAVSCLSLCNLVSERDFNSALAPWVAAPYAFSALLRVTKQDTVYCEVHISL